MARIISIVAPKGFQEIEYVESKQALEKKGHQVFMGSKTGFAYDKAGREYPVDFTLDEIKVEDFDVILFVGGPGSYDYFNDPTCHRLAREFYEAEKLTTAICAAPVILARAGLLEGKKATCWEGESENLKQEGAKYSGAAVEKDGRIITGSGPSVAYEFGQMIADSLI